ncbi:MAG: DUF3467 domain-containing protein [Alistipes sp.]|nr:DUF3467 domain-containing protein [Alistipes sp.]
MEEAKKGGIELNISDEIAQGKYCNFALITHSTSEFILDFATILPGIQKPQVKSRIILTPEHAKRLLKSLQDNITRYESVIGKIELPTPQHPQGMKIGEA